MRHEMMDPECTLDIPASALLKRRWYNWRYVLPGILILAALIFLLIPSKTTVPPVLTPIVVPIPVPAEVKISKEESKKKFKVKQPKEMTAPKIAQDNVAFKAYLKPSDGKMEAGLKFTIFKKELSVKKNFDYVGFLRKLARD